MARYKIYSSDGTKVRYEGSPIYNGTYLKASYLEFREICSPVPIEWEVGDYVVYDRTGLTYRLYSIPLPKKTARRQSYGGAFVYQNVQLHCATKQFEIAPFRDLVSADNTIHFSTMPNVDTFENVEGIAARIQASLDQMYPDSWEVNVNLNLDAEILERVKEARAFSVSNGTCMDALDQIYSVWEDIGWVYSYDSVRNKNVLTIAGANSRTATNTTEDYQYGKGKGLITLRKFTGNNEEFATRLYVYGNTTNMMPRYYNGKNIVDKDSVNIQHLMIPISSWGKTNGIPDAKLAYIQASSAAVSKFGLIPKNVYFDGSEYEDIHPSISKMTIGEIRAVKDELADAEYYPSTIIYSAEERVDEVKDVTNPDDDGLSAPNGKSFTDQASVDVDYSRRLDKDSGVDYSGTLASVSLENTNNTKKLKLIQQLLITLSTAGGSVTNPEITINVVASGAVLWTTRRSLAHDISAAVPTWKTMLTDIELETDAPTDNLSLTYSITLSNTVQLGALKVTGKTTFMESYKLTSTFDLVIKQIGFDISERMALGTEGKCSVSFKDGMCAGRSFLVKKVEYRRGTDDWLLTMHRGEDTSLGMFFPNSTYTIQPNDHFVLLDIVMPEMYVQTAERRLLAAGQRLLADVSRIKPNYEPEIDAKYMVENHSRLMEGMYMKLTDGDVVDDNTTYVLIDTISINENDANIPTYKVTLREQKSYSFRQSISSASSPSSMSSLGGSTVSTSRATGDRFDSDSYYTKEDIDNIIKRLSGDLNFFILGESEISGTNILG